MTYDPDNHYSKFDNFANYIAYKKEQEFMTIFKKRPALEWDNGKKPLPYNWLLYSKGKLVTGITQYNVEEQTFNAPGEHGLLKCYNQPFIVKRIS